MKRKIFGKFVFTASTIRRATTVAVVLLLGVGVSAVIVTNPFNNKVSNPISSNITHEEHYNDINVDNLLDEDEDKDVVLPVIVQEEIIEEEYSGGGGGSSHSSNPGIIETHPEFILEPWTVNYSASNTYTLITSEGIAKEGTGIIKYCITSQPVQPAKSAFVEFSSLGFANTVQDAGVYNVYYYLQGINSYDDTAITKLGTFTINGDDGNITDPTYTSPIDLNGASSINLLTTPASSTSGTVMYNVSTDATVASGTYTTDTPVATKRGTYYVWYYSDGDASHNDTDVKRTDAIVVIDSSIKEPGRITQTPLAAGTSLSYNNGSPVALLSRMAVSDTGTVKYKVTESATKPTSDSGFSAYSSSPTATGAAGQTKTYYVWYFSKGDATHEDTDFKSVGPIQIKDNGSSPQPTLYCATPSAPSIKGPFQFDNTAHELISASVATDGSTVYYYVTNDESESPTVSDITSTDIPAVTAIGKYYVWYCAKQDGYISTSPKKVGPIFINGIPGKVEIAPIFNGTLSYNNSNQPLLFEAGSSSTGTMMYYASNENVAPTDKGNFDNTVPQGKAVGKYYVWYYSSAIDANHEDTEITRLNGFVEIKGSNGVIDEEPTLIDPSTVDYTGGDYNLVATAGESSTGTILFARGLDLNTAPSISQFTLTADDFIKSEADVYHIWYYLKGNDGYSNVDPKPLGTATIVKHLATCTTEPSARGNNGILSYTSEPLQLINGGEGVENGTIHYSLGTASGPGSWVELAERITGTDAQKYYVWWYIEGDDTHSSTNQKCITVTIRDNSAQVLPKATITTTPKAITGLYEIDSEQQLVTPGSAENGVMKYGLSQENIQPNIFTEEIPAVQEHGTYYVWYFADGNDTEYQDSSINKVQVKINSEQAAILTSPNPIANLAYNGGEQTLVSAGTTNGAGMMYAVTQKGASYPPTTDTQKWTIELPKAKDVGQYTVWYYALGSDVLDKGNSDIENVQAEIVLPKAQIQGSPTVITDLVVKYNTDLFEERQQIELTDQEVINTNTVSSTVGTTLRYAVTASSDSQPVKTSAAWSSITPKVKNAGDYKIWYYADGGDDYTDSDVYYVTASVAKCSFPMVRDGELAFRPTRTADEITFDGQNHTLFVLKDDPTYANGTIYYYVCPYNGSVDEQIQNGYYDRFPFKPKAQLTDSDLMKKDVGEYRIYCYIASNDNNYRDLFLGMNSVYIAPDPSNPGSAYSFTSNPTIEQSITYSEGSNVIIRNAGVFGNGIGSVGVAWFAITDTNEEPEEDQFIGFGFSDRTTIQYDSRLYVQDPGKYYVWYYGTYNEEGDPDYYKSSVYCKTVLVQKHATYKTEPRLAGSLASSNIYKLTSEEDVPIIPGTTDGGVIKYLITQDSSEITWKDGTTTLPTVSAPGHYIISYYIEGDEYHYSQPRGDYWIGFDVIADASFISHPSISSDLPSSYDGLTHSILTSESKGQAKGGTIYYYLFTDEQVRSETFSNELFSTVFSSSYSNSNLTVTEPGKYHLYYYIKASQGYVDTDYKSIEFTYNKKNPIIPQTVSAVSDLKDNGTNHELISFGSYDMNSQSPIRFAMSLTNTQPNELSLTSIPKAKDAGTYYVWWQFSEDAHYNASSVQGPIEVEIEPGVRPKASYSVLPVERLNQEYDGTSLPLIQVPGESNDGEVKYALTTYYVGNEVDRKSLSFSTNTPYATNAGTYYVWYFIDSNTVTKDDTSISYLTVTIDKGFQALDEPIVVSDPVPFDGELHNLVITPPTFTGNSTVEYYVTNSSAEPNETTTWGGFNTTKVADPGTYYIWYRSTETMNYEASEPRFAIAIIKGPGVIEVHPHFISSVDTSKSGDGSGEIEYTGDYILPITAGQSSTGTMKYAVLVEDNGDTDVKGGLVPGGLPAPAPGGGGGTPLLPPDEDPQNIYDNPPAKSAFSSDLASISDDIKDPGTVVIWYYSDAGDSNLFSDSAYYKLVLDIYRKKVYLTTKPSISATGVSSYVNSGDKNVIYEVPYGTTDITLVDGECTTGGTLKYQFIPDYERDGFNNDEDKYSFPEDIKLNDPVLGAGNYLLTYYAYCESNQYYMADDYIDRNTAENKLYYDGVILSIRPIPDTFSVPGDIATDLVENGQSQKLFTTMPKGAHGELYFIIEDGEYNPNTSTAPDRNTFFMYNPNDETKCPPPMRKDAGKYTIWYYSDGGDSRNYTYSEIQHVTVEISTAGGKTAPTLIDNHRSFRDVSEEKLVTVNNPDNLLINYCIDSKPLTADYDFDYFEQSKFDHTPTMIDYKTSGVEIKPGTFYISYNYSSDGGSTWSDVHAIPFEIGYVIDQDGISSELSPIDREIYFADTQIQLVKKDNLDPEYAYFACVTPDNVQPSKDGNGIYWRNISKGDIYFDGSFSAPGVYYVWWYAIGTDGDTGTYYAPTEIKGFPVEIKKSKAFFKSNIIPVGRTVSYSGSSNNLLQSKGMVDPSLGFVIKYLVKPGDYSGNIETEKENFSDAYPVATNPGTYRVYYYIQGTDIYDDSDIGYVTAGIDDMEVEYEEPELLLDDFVYNGSPIEIIRPGTIYNLADGIVSFKYAYQKASITTVPTAFSTNIPAPSQVGVYNVYWYIEGPDGPYNEIKKLDGTVEIKKSSASINLNDPSMFIETNTVSENGQYINLLTSSLTEEIKDGRNVYFCVTPYTEENDPDKSAFTDSEPKVVSAGTYYVWWYTPATSNYKESAIQRSTDAITIGEQTGLVEPKQTSATLVYDGEDHDLIKENTGISNQDIGRYEYAVMKGSQSPKDIDFKAGTPKAKNAGTYTVYYRYKYILSGQVKETSSFTISIGKKSISILPPRGASDLSGVIIGANGKTMNIAQLGTHEFHLADSDTINVIYEAPTVDSTNALIGYLVIEEQEDSNIAININSYFQCVDEALLEQDLPQLTFDPNIMPRVINYITNEGYDETEFMNHFGSLFNMNRLVKGEGSYQIYTVAIPYEYFIYAMDPQGSYDGNYYLYSYETIGKANQKPSNMEAGSLVICKNPCQPNVQLSFNSTNVVGNAVLFDDEGGSPITVVNKSESLVTNTGSGKVKFYISSDNFETGPNIVGNFGNRDILPKSEFVEDLDLLTVRYPLPNDPKSGNLQYYYIYFYGEGDATHSDSQITKYITPVGVIPTDSSPIVTPPSFELRGLEGYGINFVSNYYGKFQLFGSNTGAFPGTAAIGEDTSAGTVRYQITAVDASAPSVSSSDWKSASDVIIEQPGLYKLWYLAEIPSKSIIDGPNGIELMVYPEFLEPKGRNKSYYDSYPNLIPDLVDESEIILTAGDPRPDLHIFTQGELPPETAVGAEIRYHIEARGLGEDQLPSYIINELPDSEWKTWSEFGNKGPEVPAAVDNGIVTLYYKLFIKSGLEERYQIMDTSSNNDYVEFTVKTIEPCQDPETDPFDLPTILTNPIIINNTATLIDTSNMPSTPTGWQFRYYYSKTTTLPRLDQFTSVIPTVTQPGTYYVYRAAFNITSNTDVTDIWPVKSEACRPTKVVIEKQKATFVEGKEPESIGSIQYNGVPQSLMKPGTGVLPSSTTVLYAVLPEGDSSGTIPTPTNSDFKYTSPLASEPDTYHVYAKIISASNFLDNSDVLYCFSTRIFPTQFKLSDLSEQPEFYSALDLQFDPNSDPRKPMIIPANPIIYNPTIEGGEVTYYIATSKDGYYDRYSYSDLSTGYNNPMQYVGTYYIKYNISSTCSQRSDSEFSDVHVFYLKNPASGYYVAPDVVSEITVEDTSAVQLIDESSFIVYRSSDDADITNDPSVKMYYRMADDSGILSGYINVDENQNAWDEYLDEYYTDDISEMVASLDVDASSMTKYISCIIEVDGEYIYGANDQREYNPNAQKYSGGVSVDWNSIVEITLRKPRTKLSDNVSGAIPPVLLDSVFADQSGEEVLILDSSTGKFDGPASYRFYVTDDPFYEPTYENDYYMFESKARVYYPGTYYVYYFIMSKDNNLYVDSDVYYLGDIEVQETIQMINDNDYPHLATYVSEDGKEGTLVLDFYGPVDDFFVSGSIPSYQFEYVMYEGAPSVDGPNYEDFREDYRIYLDREEDSGSLYTIWWRCKPVTSNEWSQPEYLILHVLYESDDDNDLRTYPLFASDIPYDGDQHDLVVRNADGDYVTPNGSTFRKDNSEYLYAVTTDPNYTPTYNNTGSDPFGEYSYNIPQASAVGVYYVHYLARNWNSGDVSCDFVREVRIIGDPTHIATIKTYADPISVRTDKTTILLSNYFTGEADENSTLWFKVQAATDPAPTVLGVAGGFASKIEDVDTIGYGEYKVWYYAKGEGDYQDSDVFNITVSVNPPIQLEFTIDPTFLVDGDGLANWEDNYGRIFGSLGEFEGEGHVRVNVNYDGYDDLSDAQAAANACIVPDKGEGSWYDYFSDILDISLNGGDQAGDYKYYVIYYYIASDDTNNYADSFGSWKVVGMMTPSKQDRKP